MPSSLRGACNSHKNRPHQRFPPHHRRCVAKRLKTAIDSGANKSLSYTWSGGGRLNNAMKALSMVLAITLGLASAMNACSQESRLPTQVASLQLEPSRYSELIASLDAALLSSGLARYGAAPGLNEIYGRNVLYFEYRVHSTD